MTDNELTMSPFGAYIGIEIVEYHHGISKCQVELKDYHLNTGGLVHGGVLTTLADTAAGVAVRSARPIGASSATTDLSISFIRPPQGTLLEAFAKVIHAGKRLFRVEISVLSADKLVAKTNATFMIFEPKV